MPATIPAEHDAPFGSRGESREGARAFRLTIWTNQELPRPHSLMARVRAAVRTLRGRHPTGLHIPGVTIIRDSEVLGGKAVVAGTRIPIFMIRDVYGEDRDVGRVAESYPELTEEEIMGALLYAAHVDPDGIAADREAYYRAIREHLRA